MSKPSTLTICGQRATLWLLKRFMVVVALMAGIVFVQLSDIGLFTHPSHVIDGPSRHIGTMYLTPASPGAVVFVAPTAR